jgi:quercetin dioxygenase-like cupin family protein
MRLLVTGKETDNAFAVVGTGGTFDQPIGFHYHKEAHDVFLCLKGKINVWANDKARSLGPGDFASVPPVSYTSHHLTCGSRKLIMEIGNGP